MKTKNACFWIFLLLSGSAYAQMSQKGTVQIFNSNKSPLPGVQLTATDAPATDTDANGNFQFNFSKQKPGMAIASPNVYKKGYEQLIVAVCYLFTDFFDLVFIDFLCFFEFVHGFVCLSH